MKKLDDLVEALPRTRRSLVQKRTKKAVERIAISELRKLVGMSQSELARRMKLRQPTPSQIEPQTDMKISALAGMVTSLGGTMRIILDLPQGEFVICNSTARA